MPIKNIIPGQSVTKEKLQRAKELRRDMTPAEKALWQELRANKLGVHFGGDKSLRDSSLTFIVTKQHLSSKSMEISMIRSKMRILDASRC